MSDTVPWRWSMTMSSLTKAIANSGHAKSLGGASGRCSTWRTASHPMKPTSPPVSGGFSGFSGDAQRA